MNRERCWELLARKLANEATDAERNELGELLRQFPDMNYAGELAGSIRQADKRRVGEDEVAAFMKMLGSEEAVATIDDALSKQPRGPVRWKWLAAAVVTGIIVAAGVWLTGMPGGAGGKGGRNEIVTRNGSRTSIELPDGSIVKLNGGSRLVYEDGFGKKDRSVVLEGEAFFDVKPDPAHPFIVHTRSLAVRVLGTSFNVNTHGEAVETVLIQGKVEVQLNNREESRIVLKPLEKLRVSGAESGARAPASGNATYEVSTVHRNEEVDEFPETAWLNNKLVFKDESFASLGARMERWFNVHIQISGETLKREELTGVFQNENIVQALNALQVIAPFNYHQSSDTIYIQPK